MRTRAEWFSLLPDDVREKAIFNTSQCSFSGPFTKEETEKMLSLPQKNMRAAIQGAFIYGNTDEGKEYWRGIANDPQWKQYEENK